MRFQGQEDKGKAVKKKNHTWALLALYLSQVWCGMDKKKKQICTAMLNLTSHLLPLFSGWYLEMFDNGSSLDNFLRHDKIRRPIFDLLSLDTVLDSVYGH